MSNMSKLSEWKLAQRMQEANRRDLLIVLGIVVAIIAITILVIVKVKALKGGLGCEDCDFDDFDDIDGDVDENGCAYTSEKDFV